MRSIIVSNSSAGGANKAVRLGVDTKIAGNARHRGNLTIGNPDMAEGLLYVDGDVTITGTVKGKGAIVATGKSTVTGSRDTQADHAALVAKDDIAIHRDGPNSSRFQGWVYSEKSIDIAACRLAGGRCEVSRRVRFDDNSNTARPSFGQWWGHSGSAAPGDEGVSKAYGSIPACYRPSRLGAAVLASGLWWCGGFGD
ncbi:MAG: hypothetical protein WC314_21250 [Vulcanimicrobiota bacterium]